MDDGQPRERDRVFRRQDRHRDGDTPRTISRFAATRDLYLAYDVRLDEKFQTQTGYHVFDLKQERDRQPPRGRHAFGLLGERKGAGGRARERGTAVWALRSSPDRPAEPGEGEIPHRFTLLICSSAFSTADASQSRPVIGMACWVRMDDLRGIDMLRLAALVLTLVPFALAPAAPVPRRGQAVYYSTTGRAK